MARKTFADATRHARPRDRAARDPREAQVARTRGRRPRKWVHTDACEGRHVACETGVHTIINGARAENIE